MTRSLVVVILFSAVAQAGTYYVATDGNDAGLGTKASPWATIDKARDEIAGTTGNTVYIRGGTYRITEAIAFDSGDSGAAGAPNVYWNYPGETPVISGGKILAGTWVVHNGSVWKLAGVTDQFNSLFVDGARATLAKEPDAGYYYVIGSVEGEQQTAFEFEEGAIDSTWTNLTSVQVVYLTAWMSPRQYIESVDNVNNIVRLGGTSATSLGSNERYYVESLFEGLDQPGEWYLDAVTDTLYYYPVDGKNPNTSEIVIPVLGRDLNNRHGYLIDVQGTSSTVPASYIEFRGLVLTHVDWYLHEDGFPGYAEELEYYEDPTGLGPAIALKNVSHIDFCDNVLQHIGGHGVVVDGDYVNLCHNTINDIGGTAVKIGKLVSGYTDRTSSYVTVADNVIFDIANVWLSGVGILTNISDHGWYAHNTIHDAHYMGINVGRGTAYGGDCSHNEVAYNNIYDVQKSLGDGSAIYFVGENVTGSSAHHNKIHDCNALSSDEEDLSSMGGWGLYLDESATGVSLHDNWLYRINRGLHINTAYSCSITNNVFAGAKYGFMTYGHAQGTTIQRNIYYNLDVQGIPYLTMYPAMLNPYDQDYNLWYNTLVDYQVTWDARVAAMQADADWYGYVNLSKQANGSTIATHASGLVFTTRWVSGMPVTIGVQEYTLDSVADTTHMTILNGPDTASNVFYQIHFYPDAHGILQDPLFVDFANDDYTLQTESPALDAQGSGGIGFEQIEGMARVGPRQKILRVR